MSDFDDAALEEFRDCRTERDRLREENERLKEALTELLEASQLVNDAWDHPDALNGFMETDGLQVDPIGDEQVDDEFWDNFDMAYMAYEHARLNAQTALSTKD